MDRKNEVDKKLINSEVQTSKDENILDENKSVKPFDISASKKNKLVYILMAIVVLFVGWGVYKIANPSPTLAQIYLQTVKEDIENVSEHVQFYQGAFADVSDSFDKSKQAFYEITSSRTYDEAVVDTKQDIVEIEETLSMIEEARENKSRLKLPEKLIIIDARIDMYYQATTDALNILLEHEKFQMVMLNEYGSTINVKMSDLSSLFTKMQLLKETGSNEDIFAEMFDLVKDISIESQLALDRFNTIEDIPVLDERYYPIKIEDLEDLSRSFNEFLDLLDNLSEESAIMFGQGIVSFGERVQERNTEIQAHSDYLVNGSTLTTQFDLAYKYEIEIFEAIDNLEKGITVDPGFSDPPNPNATSSSKPKKDNNSGHSKEASKSSKIVPEKESTPGGKPKL